MYNDNKYFIYQEIFVIIIQEGCIMKYLLSLYKRVYNDNKYFLIHENVFLVIQDDV